MQENNTFRMIMFIGAILVVGLLIHALTQNYDDIKIVIDKYSKFRLQKY